MVRKIHQIWLQGEEKLPDKYKKYVDKYRTLNAPYGWEYKLWDEKSIRDLIKAKYPELLDIYDGYPFWVMRVDLGKYCILDSEGGILIDMDTNPLQSFEGLFKNNPAVIFYPHKKGSKHNFHPLEKIFVNRITNNNFIYVPTPNHPFSKLLLKRAQCVYKRKPWDFKLYYVIGSIGPLFLIDTIEEYGRENIEWIPENISDEYFKDERANSWNKKHYDNHDVLWGFAFLIGIFMAIYCCYRAGM